MLVELMLINMFSGSESSWLFPPFLGFFFCFPADNAESKALRSPECPFFSTLYINLCDNVTSTKFSKSDIKRLTLSLVIATTVPKRVYWYKKREKTSFDINFNWLNDLLLCYLKGDYQGIEEMYVI